MRTRKGRVIHIKKIHAGKSVQHIEVYKKKPKGAIPHQKTKNIRFYLYRGKEIAVPKRGVKIVK